MSKLNIKNLIKSFPSMDRPAVNNVNLDIESGELVAFLGPSGCGKTTILKMITGLFQPDNGDIILDEQSLLKIPTEKRGVVMVFQNYLLFPYMNVNENVGFALSTTTLALVAGFAVLSFSGFKVNADMAMLTAITIAIALFIDLFFLPTLLMAIDKVKFKQNNKLKVNT